MKFGERKKESEKGSFNAVFSAAIKNRLKIIIVHVQYSINRSNNVLTHIGGSAAEMYCIQQTAIYFSLTINTRANLFVNIYNR